ncbi:MAG TPA: hypothetical protein VNL14_16125 [Candidatus Acidoferrales bacterium]|nr:hypothetical protein [Candidatus Acidoferrales bacterium]
MARDHEVEISGGLFHAQRSDTGALNLDLVYGYYLTPGWEIGFRQALNYNFIEDERDVWNATTSPFLNYNFRVTERILPFLGGFIGLVWNDRDATGTIGPNTGVKIFLTDQTYFVARYRYEWFFDSLKEIGDEKSRGNHVVNFGIGFVWGGQRPGGTR